MRKEKEKDPTMEERKEQPASVEETEENIQSVEEQQDDKEEPLSELEQLQKQYDELNDRYLRLMAEYDNFRKRTQREKDELYGNAAASTVEKFLGVWDNLERASAYEAGGEEFTKGFELIVSGFQETLKSLGIEPIGEIGEAFDPAIHYAVSHIEDEGLGENVVSQVMQKGYKMGDRVVRYAMVQTAN